MEVLSRADGRDVGTISLPRWGRVVPAEGTVPWMVVDPDGVPVEPIRRFLVDFVARDNRPGSVRSYGYGLLRWWRWLHCTKQVDTPRPGSDTACRVAAKAASRWACLIAGTAVLARPLSAACAVASLGARSYELARGPTFVGIDGPSTLDSDTVETTVPT